MEWESILCLAVPCNRASKAFQKSVKILFRAIFVVWGLGLLTFTGLADAIGPPKIPTKSPPLVNIAIHSVPLDKVVFDTFDGGYIRLSRAQPPLREKLRDAIRPIYAPRYGGPEEGDWLQPRDLVVGYIGPKEAYAYPVKVLNFHEIVNDVIGHKPVLITYCPLCRSGVIYDRRLDGRELVFGNTSALFENDMVMYDHQTGSYWFQVAGKAIVGTLTGKQLRPLPSVIMPWNRWRKLHSNTRVLARLRGYAYDRDSFASYAAIIERWKFPFPVSLRKLDTRLRPAEIVLSVKHAGMEKAYPLDRLGDFIVNDTIGTEPVVVFSQASGPTGSAFSRRLAGRSLTFILKGGTTILDQQTKSQWDMSGRAVFGTLKGQGLRSLPTRRAFWFSLSLSMPGIPLFWP